jgi:hypothetical protein
VPILIGGKQVKPIDDEGIEIDANMKIILEDSIV